MCCLFVMSLLNRCFLLDGLFMRDRFVGLVIIDFLVLGYFY